MRILFNNRGSMSLSESLALKAVSLLLALILWITILGFKREQVRKAVPFEPMLPPGMTSTERIPKEIIFTLSGPRVLLKDVEKKIQAIRPDLKNSRETVKTITLSEAYLGELPVGVKMDAVEPAKVIIPLEEIVERYVPVKPTVIGSPASGFEIGKVVANPSKIPVAGAKSLVQNLEFVGTQPIDVQELSGNRTTTGQLVVDTSQGYRLSRETEVEVKITTKRVSKGP